MTMQEILDRINEGDYNEREMTNLPYEGESPWGGTDCPVGVWAWNEADDEVLIGEDAFEIVSYAQALGIYTP